MLINYLRMHDRPNSVAVSYELCSYIDIFYVIRIVIVSRGVNLDSFIYYFLIGFK